MNPRPSFLPGPGAQAPDDLPAAGRSPAPAGAVGDGGGDASGRSAAGAAAIVPSTEPNWGDLQDAYRVLRSYGYAMVRRRSGGILVDGHRFSAKAVRDLVTRLQTGRVGWQRGGKR